MTKEFWPGKRRISITNLSDRIIFSLFRSRYALNMRDGIDYAPKRSRHAMQER